MRVFTAKKCRAVLPPSAVPSFDEKGHLVRAAAFMAVMVVLALSVAVGPASWAAAPMGIVAHRSAVVRAGETTEFLLDLSHGVTVEVFTLSDPYRVVIELPEVVFRLPSDAGTTALGLISGYGFGAYAEGRSRIVIATSGPVAIAQAKMINHPNANVHGVQLRLQLTPMEAAAFGRGTGAAREAAVGAAVKPAAFDDGLAVSGTRSRPVVMIDPGHGGVDPGAVGSAKTLEKNIVLAVALQLKAALEDSGRYEVRLTRGTDVFIPLDQRVQLSRAANADIFISLHADTIDDKSLAQAIRGASVYTLSDKASNEGSRLMAEKENAADLAAGMAAPTLVAGDDVKPILYDLMARETATFSHLLSRSMVSAIGRRHTLTHDPERSAAFRVLKQAHAPSVLIELGFLSNGREEQVMTQAAWQREIAGAISSAITSYFDRKSAHLGAQHVSGVPLAVNATATTLTIDSFGGLPP
jgi:N-acetylmuramoyl-L-alanine amidase